MSIDKDLIDYGFKVYGHECATFSQRDWVIIEQSFGYQAYLVRLNMLELKNEIIKELKIYKFLKWLNERLKR